MHRVRLRLISSALLALAVAACGGGEEDGFTPDDGSNPGGGGTTSALRLGSLNNGTFTPGVIQVGVSPLAAGGSSGLQVVVVDTANDNALVTQDVDVTFSSACATGGSNALAVIDPVTVSTGTGTASATYRAQGCSGDDIVRASAVVNGATLTAEGTIRVLPATLGAIEFVSATPANIGIRGVGRQETSTVVFRVRNQSGGTVPNQTVNFSLNTNLGDVRLAPVTGITNSEGLVQTVVTSGTVATPVRVTASAGQGATLISSQSELLTITTGIPDQNSFSISAQCANVEGLTRDNVIVPILLLAADRYNNPVPDDTAVTFTTEGGAIIGSCGMQNGACTVNWRSQNPRPPAYNGCDRGSPDNTDAACAAGGTRGAARAGRVTVTALAIGEESFDDADSDGLFDVGERYEDGTEAFVDWNGNGVRDDGTVGGMTAPDVPVEPFFDFAPLGSASGSNGLFDAADGQFNGLLCDNRPGASQGRPPPGADLLCGLPRTKHVTHSLELIMSGSAPDIDPARDITVTPASAYDPLTGRITLNSKQSITLSVVLRDVNLQPLPAETEVAFVASGDAGDTVGTDNYTVPCRTDDTAAANRYSVTFLGDELENGETASGVLELRVTSPSGLQTIRSFPVETRTPEN